MTTLAKRNTNSLPATSIPLDPDHPFHLLFLTWRTLCARPSLWIRRVFEPLTTIEKGLFFFSFFFQLNSIALGTPADCYTPRANGEIIIKDPQHCTVSESIGLGMKYSYNPSQLCGIALSTPPTLCDPLPDSNTYFEHQLISSSVLVSSIFHYILISWFLSHPSERSS